MLRVTHKNLFRLAGAIWLAIGVFLLQKGVDFLLQALAYKDPRLFSWTVEEILLLLVASLGLGTIKGRMVLKKAATRICDRIARFHEPTSIFNMYGVTSIFVILLMGSLGFLMRLLHIPLDVRGCIDVAVGTALIRGSFYYFQYTPELALQTTSQEQDS